MNTAISERLMEITVKLTSPLPTQRRLAHVHPGFDVAHDVLQHHHRIVDHEAGGDGERHQREIVDAVAEQVHRPERAEDGKRQNHRRNQRRARGLQEHEHHADDQHHGDHQAALGIAHGGGHRLRAVHGDVHLDVGRQGRLDRRQHLLDLRDGLDDVRAGQRIDDHAHRRQIVVEAGVADVLVRIHDRRPHRAAAPARRCGRR